MLQLHNLQKLKKARKRVGRGGDRGGTSGKGHKGQLARTGGRANVRPFFEGGQMPLSRRLPRRGFTNVFKKQFVLISLSDLEAKFNDGDVVNMDQFVEKGFIKNKEGKAPQLVKVLCNGTLSKKLTVHAHAFSKSAIEAINKAGGTAEKEL